MVLRFPLPFEVTLLVEDPWGDRVGRDTGTTLRFTLEGVRVELCHDGPAEGPGRFAAPLMVSRFTVADGDLERTVGAGDLERAAAGAGDFARVEVVAGDLAPAGPSDDRELRLEADDVRWLLFGGDLVCGV